MNYQILDQKRKGIQFLINENPESILIFRKTMIPDGFDGFMEDPNSTPDPNNIKCRISKEKRGPEGFGIISSGLSVSGSWFILVNHKTMIYKDEPFESRDRQWRIGAVTQLLEHGGIIAYEAPLIEAETIEGEES